MDLDTMMGMDLFWGGNYTIIDGPLKRTYDSSIESSETYNFKERFFNEDSDKLELNIPDAICDLVKKIDRLLCVYRNFNEFKAVYQRPHAPLLSALIQRHVLTHALLEKYMLDCIKEENHQESLSYLAWQSPFFAKKYDIKAPYNTLSYVDPIRYTFVYKEAWIKDYRQAYVSDAQLFALSLKLSSLEQFALNYNNKANSTRLVDYFLFTEHTFKLEVDEIEKIISDHKILCEKEKRFKAISASNSRRHKKSQHTHVLRYSQGKVSYSTLNKSQKDNCLNSVIKATIIT